MKEYRVEGPFNPKLCGCTWKVMGGKYYAIAECPSKSAAKKVCAALNAKDQPND